MRRRTLLLAAALAAAPLLAHVRLHNLGNGNVLYWSNPASVSIVINDAGSDDLAASEHVPALRMAIDEWNDVTGTTARLVENTSAAARARTDWESSSIHLVYFDEDDSSGFFPNGTGTVAITPVSFFGDGRISDADVLFNGDGFSFTTSGDPGSFDVQDVATHELGHLLGLDHTGVAGAAMYPYVSPSVTLHRSLARDDSGGIAAANPTGERGGLTGTVRRASNSTAVAGAFVVARDAAGRTAGSTLADGSGVFLLRGLVPGDYELYAIPLDTPVSGANLTPGHLIATDFQPILGASATVSAGVTASYGELLVGPDSTLVLGRNFDEFPQRVTAGQASVLTLHGGAMGAACTLTASDPLVTVAPINWLGSTQVTFSVTVPPGATPGHVDLTLSNGATSILAGALEVTPEDPAVASVVPNSGAATGGDALTITGSGFSAGARVVIGDTLYEDGEAGGCMVVDAATITLTTLAPAIPGTYDVVVVDETGVEGRASAAFTFVSAPEIDVVFPAAGSTSGGTLVTVTGSGFLEPMLVRVDGVLQASVVVESTSTLRFTTDATAAGVAVVELEDPDGDVASSAFSFVAAADPVAGALSPAGGSTSGGALVTITGSNFHAGHSVVFGADPDTGAGGIAASDVSLVDASTLTARAPAHSAGSTAVLVVDANTGQAAAVPDEFVYRDDSGGGGCSMAVAPFDSTWRGTLSRIAWLPLVVLALLAQRRRSRAVWA